MSSYQRKPRTIVVHCLQPDCAWKHLEFVGKTNASAEERAYPELFAARRAVGYLERHKRKHAAKPFYSGIAKL